MASLEKLLEETVPPVTARRLRRRRKTPPLIAAWAEQEGSGGLFKRWARGQVAAYRIGLVVGYLAMIYFGMSAFVAGVPTFEITTPRGWVPIWSMIVVVGGLVAAIGAIKAGTEPVTREVRVFNRIELGGAIALFLTLGTYAVYLLVLGYLFSSADRAATGAGFMALGVHPAVRMVWLIFRPRVPKPTKTA